MPALPRRRRVVRQGECSRPQMYRNRGIKNQQCSSPRTRKIWSQVRSVSLETKQICAKALLNLIAEDTLSSLVKVRSRQFRKKK